ncbi:MAG: hypothetical protein FWG45_06375, partial [Oscillospiraceae bacterium]|nr:hypothetical protein [Oscillospiraceae bacterium]
MKTRNFRKVVSLLLVVSLLISIAVPVPTSSAVEDTLEWIINDSYSLTFGTDPENPNITRVGNRPAPHNDHVLKISNIGLTKEHIPALLANKGGFLDISSLVDAPGNEVVPKGTLHIGTGTRMFAAWTNLSATKGSGGGGTTAPPNQNDEGLLWDVTGDGSMTLRAQPKNDGTWGLRPNVDFPTTGQPNTGQPTTGQPTTGQPTNLTDPSTDPL